MNDQGTLVDLWIHHSSFFWQQVRALPYIEAVVLAGAYALYDGHPKAAAAVLMLGAVVTALIFLMLRRHLQYVQRFRGAAGTAIPEPDPPLMGWKSHSIAIWLSGGLPVFNILLMIWVKLFGL